MTSCWSTRRWVASTIEATWSGSHDRDLGRPRERQVLPEPLGLERRPDLRQPRAAAAQVDPAGSRSPAGELLDDELDPGRPDRRRRRRRSPRARRRRSTCEPAGVVDLERLGPRERQVEPVGDRLRERAPAEREHPGALDPALTDERDVGRPAADVDEERPGLLDLVGTEDPGDRVRLGDDLEELEVELAGDALERAEVDERRERVEDPDPHVAALEADRVRDRVAVDAAPRSPRRGRAGRRRAAGRSPR